MTEDQLGEISIDLEDVDLDSFRAFMKYLYYLDFLTIKTKSVNTTQLLYIADYYSQDDLMEACLNVRKPTTAPLPPKHRKLSSFTASWREDFVLI